MAKKKPELPDGVQHDRRKAERRAEPGRTYRLLRLEIVVVGMICLTLTLGLAYLSNLNGVKNLQHGCERANVRTQTTYDFFVAGAEKVRGDAAAAPSDAERLRLEDFAMRFQVSADQILNATDVDLRKSPESPQAVCPDAFPYPWPL